MLCRVAGRSAVRRLPAWEAASSVAARRRKRFDLDRQRAAHVTSRLDPRSPSRPAGEARSCSSEAPARTTRDIVRRGSSRMAEDSHRTRPRAAQLELKARDWCSARQSRSSPSRVGRRASHRTVLMLTRIDPRGRAHSVQIIGERLPEELRGATGRARARRAHGARDRVVRHRQTDRDDRSGVRRTATWKGRVRSIAGFGDFPAGAAPRSGRRLRGCTRRWTQALLERGRAACVARETAGARSSDFVLDRAAHDRLRADAEPDRRSAATEWVSAGDPGLTETPSSGRGVVREPSGRP